MKSTWFHRPAHYAFAKILRESSHNDFGTIFRDFLECAAIAVVQPILATRAGAIDAKAEEDYLRTINRQKGYAECFPKAMASLIEGLEENTHDFLGDVSAAIGCNDVSYRGQCFTPWPVCQAMAEMTLADTKPDPNHRLTLNEPACGGGAMVLATVAKLRENGFTPADYYFVAQDVDIKCFHMAFLQLSLCGVPASVIWGNTLTLETWKTWPTFATLFHPWREPAEPKSTPAEAFRVRTRKK